MSYLQKSYDNALKELEAVKYERDDAVDILQRLMECRRTCGSMMQFAVSAKTILNDARKWEKR